MTTKKSKARKRRTKAEAIREKARKEPSQTCHDPRQISLFDLVKSKAFAELDKAIEEALGGKD
jgi:hypothetical protein